MDCDDFEKNLKIIVVGNGNVGKTSISTKYTKGIYTNQAKKTIGVDFMEKQIFLDDLQETINMMIWDTAGQDQFDTLTSRYYKDAGAVVYVFSTTDRKSFDDLLCWKEKVEEECGRIIHVLVQNKIDLLDDARMESVEVEEKARQMHIKLFRTCVTDNSNININEVFEYLCRQYIKEGSRTTLGTTTPKASFSQAQFRDMDCPVNINLTQNEDQLASLQDQTQQEYTPKIMIPSKQRTGGKKNRIPTQNECNLS